MLTNNNPTPSLVARPRPATSACRGWVLARAATPRACASPPALLTTRHLFLPLPPALQVDKEAVAPFVPRLLRALVMCFKDASWPVSGWEAGSGCM